MTGRSSFAAGLLAALALVGCGIGDQHGVERIGPDALGGLDLTVPAAPTSTIAAGLVAATMYYIEGDTLVPVTVDVPVLSVRAYLAALEAGPPQAALDRGVRSAIPPGLVSSVHVSLDTITVDLDGELLGTVDAEDQQNLLAQIVLSLTDLPDHPGTDDDLPTIRQVRFTLDGMPLQVLRRDNTLTEPGAPVTRQDYEQLLAPDPQ